MFSVVILLPVLLIISIFMFILKKVNKIDESIFYKQKRYGLNNKPFDIYKMRTMRTDPFIKVILVKMILEYTLCKKY